MRYTGSLSCLLQTVATVAELLQWLDCCSGYSEWLEQSQGLTCIGSAHGAFAPDLDNYKRSLNRDTLENS